MHHYPQAAWHKPRPVRPNPDADPFEAGPFDTEYFRDVNRLELSYDGPIPRGLRDAALARAYERQRLRRVAYVEGLIADAQARYDAIVRLMQPENAASELKCLSASADAVQRDIAALRERLACLAPQRTVDYAAANDSAPGAAQ